MKEKNKTKTSKGLKSKKSEKEKPAPEADKKPQTLPNGKKRFTPMNPEARKSVTSSSSWTGKLPATLLHEHCQKAKWEKVMFDMVG